jgi:fimbrial chaperone protein
MRPALFLVPLALPLIPPASAESNGVQVTPVIIAVPPDRRVTSVRVRNWRESEVSFEVTALAWRQEDGRDVLTDTADIVVAPSVFAIAPGEEQIVRLALLGAAREAGREASYRLILRQLPAGETEAGLRVQLQMSLPVFAPPWRGEAAIEAHRTPDGAGVVLTNTGSAVARLAGVTYSPEDGLDELPRYLLAGSQIVRPLPRGVGALRVVYTSLAAPEPVTQTIAVDAPLAAAGAR